MIDFIEIYKTLLKSYKKRSRDLFHVHKSPAFFKELINKHNYHGRNCMKLKASIVLLKQIVEFYSIIT